MAARGRGHLSDHGRDDPRHADLRDIGLRGGSLSYLDNLWYALLLSLMLPATLLTSPNGLAIVVSAGLLMVMLHWALPAIGHWMMHPPLLAYLLIACAFSGNLNADRILNRDHLLVGELMAPAARPIEPPARFVVRSRAESDRRRLCRACSRSFDELHARGLETPTRRWLPLSVLLRDIMPPLEDFIVAGQPGPIGTSSTLAVIICGLFLLYRGVIDFRIPLIGCLSAYVAFIMLPIPTVIAAGPQWHWAVFRLPEVGPAVAITFVNYEMLASPLIFTLFLLATTPIVCPMKRRPRTIFALLLGIVAAAFQLYVSVSYGPYSGAVARQHAVGGIGSLVWRGLRIACQRRDVRGFIGRRIFPQDKPRRVLLLSHERIGSASHSQEGSLNCFRERQNIFLRNRGRMRLHEILATAKSVITNNRTAARQRFQRRQRQPLLAGEAQENRRRPKDFRGLGFGSILNVHDIKARKCALRTAAAPAASRTSVRFFRSMYAICDFLAGSNRKSVGSMLFRIR